MGGAGRGAEREAPRVGVHHLDLAVPPQRRKVRREVGGGLQRWGCQRRAREHAAWASAAASMHSRWLLVRSRRIEVRRRTREPREARTWNHRSAPRGKRRANVFAHTRDGVGQGLGSPSHLHILRDGHCEAQCTHVSSVPGALERAPASCDAAQQRVREALPPDEDWHAARRIDDQPIKPGGRLRDASERSDGREGSDTTHPAGRPH